MAKIKVINNETGKERMMGEDQFKLLGKNSPWKKVRTADKPATSAKNDAGNDEAKKAEADKKAAEEKAAEEKAAEEKAAEEKAAEAAKEEDKGVGGNTEYGGPYSNDEGTNAATAIAKIKELGKAGELDALKNYVATDEERTSVLAAADKFLPKES